MFTSLSKFLLAGLLMTGACQGPSEIQTYKIIAPEYRKYVDNDPHLTNDQKDLRRYLIISWGMRLGL